ncbi:MAG: DUF418 domain-containing protein [Sphingobium sp.]
MTADTSSRIAAMDMLRGCAVLGILWMNVSAFALPGAAYFNPAATGPLTTGDIGVWTISLVAVDGKMRALFSMLFGASMLLLIEREEKAGRDGRRAHLIRAAWLFVLGLAHYLLLWWGDILMNYAVVGCVALLFIRQEPFALMKSALLAFFLHILLCGAFVAALYAWSHAAAAPDAIPAVREGYAAFIAGYEPGSPAIAAEIATYRGPLSGIVADHLASYPLQWLQALPFNTFDTLGFMLLGMAMLKGGFLTGRWDGEQYWRTARHCFLIGLPPMAALAVWAILSGFAPLTMHGILLLWSFPLRIPLSVGWAALLLWLFTRQGGHVLIARLIAAGRMALSNYLGSSLIMTAIFYGWGLGLFARITPAGLPLFVIGAWVAILLWSPAWQKRFASGPAEWLWRSLARGQWQKIRRNA